MCLGDAGRNRADAHLGYQLDMYAAGRVGVLEVVDQLGKVLYGVDVVMRWRRDESHPRCGVTRPGDPGVDLVAWKLPTLSRLGALGHLDLKVVAVDEVVARHAEAP